MRNARFCPKGLCLRGLLFALALILLVSTVASGANSISGSVRNQSRGEPAAGDDVVLFRLEKPTQEEARVKTDAFGAFTFPVQHPDSAYLVRVFHQGVSYDQPASSGQTLSLDVFDAATHVPAIRGSIEILRTGTVGNLLHVSDMVEIRNESSPPLTQTGDHTFEVYLPANARMDSVLAAGPGKIAEMIFAEPVPGEAGHYVVRFPLRPGATKFAFNYDLPYTGHAAFQPKFAYPLQQLAVMIPPTMKFSSRSPAFLFLATGNTRYQVQAANHLRAGEGPGFELSGTGDLPPFGEQAHSQSFSQPPPFPNLTVSAPSPAVLPALAVLDSRSKPAQPPSQLLVLTGLTCVLLAASALLLWRARKPRNLSPAQTAAPHARHARRA
jgi:hypothetical protein